MDNLQNQNQNSKKQASRKQQSNQYIKYSAIGFQMIGIILMGVFIGQWLDKKFEMEKPLLTALFSLIFVIIALYISLRDFLKS